MKEELGFVKLVVCFYLALYKTYLALEIRFSVRTTLTSYELLQHIRHYMSYLTLIYYFMFFYET